MAAHSNRLAAVAALAASLTLVGPLASQRTWWTDLSGERASVTIGTVETTWETLRIGLGITSPAWGGCAAGGERQKRSGLVDATGSLFCYRRLGGWTLAGGVAATPDAQFLPRLAAEAHVSRLIAGTVVGSVGYRVLDYPLTVVHQVQPALTWYHPRGEIEARAFLTSNEARNRTSPTGLLRVLHDVSPRFRLGGGASYGDRIFDIGSLTQSDQRAWQVYGYLRAGVTRHDFLTVGGSVAHERPAFDLRSVSVGYRRTF